MRSTVTRLVILAFGLALISACSEAPQQSATEQAASSNDIAASTVSAGESIVVSEAWVRAVPEVSKTTAAFMQIDNISDADIAIIGAASEAAAIVELHTHVTDERGIHRMEAVDMITIPAGESVVLAPGDLHIMLIDLVSPIASGDLISIELLFDDNSATVITMPVMAMAGAMDMDDHANDAVEVEEVVEEETETVEVDEVDEANEADEEDQE